MKIFILTNRGLADQHTWHAIAQSGRDLLDQYGVTLVVATEAAAEKFRHAKIPVVVSGVEGVSAARQWVIEYCDVLGETKVLMLDDDLSSWAVRHNDKFIKSIHAPRDAFRTVERLLGEHPHVGIGHRQFANNKPEYVYADRMLRALAYRVDVLKKLGIRFTLPLMEDFEVTLKLLTKGLANCVYYGVVQDQARSNAPGGCAEFRTLELQEMCAVALQGMFPRYVKLKSAEGWDLGTRTDVSIQWKRAYHGK